MTGVDVIIPVYRPSEKLLTLLLMLERQTVRPGRVIVINTERSYWDAFFASYDVASRYPFLTLHHIDKKDFDHGGTRNLGVSFSNTEFFLLMTDDAVPANEYLIEHLLSAFSDYRVGMAYARQIAQKGSGIIEKYTRFFNYPPESRLKGREDLETMGIKAFFASNVCCMYRRSLFRHLGGFTDHTLFNEDMIYARRMIDEGHLIAYRADAEVYHSHNYTGMQQLHRNFDLGVSQADHPEIFGDVKSEGEGLRLIKETCIFLTKKLVPFLIVKLGYLSACKYIGYTLGKRYDKLPRKLVLHLTTDPGYFDAGKDPGHR